MDEFNMDLEEAKSLDEIESYFPDTAYKAFVKDMRKYPVLSKEKTLELFEKYQFGDDNAFEMLVNSNLRLVVNIAKRYFSNVEHMQIMDVIQEGIIGLITAIQRYKPSEGALSTYATYWIKQKITRGITYEEAEIRKPVHFASAKGKYDKYIQNCLDTGCNIPTDEELCDILDISLETLRNIKNASILQPVSLNSFVNDEEDTEMMHFVGVDETSYDSVLEQIDTRRLMIVLKEILRPGEYYVIYYRYLIDTPKTLEELGQLFDLSRERIRQIENKALDKVQPYLEPNSERFIKIINQLNRTNIENYKVTPIEPADIAKFMYLKDSLTESEGRLLYFKLFEKYNYSRTLLASKMFCSLDELELLELSLKQKIKEKFKDSKKLKSYISQTLKNLGTQIFNIRLQEHLIDYDNIKELINKSYEDILSMYEDELKHLTESEISLLHRYFSLPEDVWLCRNLITQDVYLTVFKYKNVKPSVSNSKLYKTFLENLDEFEEEAILYLECCYFNKKDRSEFTNKYPNSNYYSRNIDLEIRLLALYYNVYGLAKNSFNQKRYLEIKARYSNKLTERRIFLLDMFYGVNGKRFTIKEIAELLKEDYFKIHGEIRGARDFCITLDANISYTLNIDYVIYEPFILNRKYEFTDETRELLKLFVIDKLDYDEISLRTNLTKYRISNIITEGIRKIDFYRYGILKPLSLTNEEFELFVNEANISDSLDKEILYSKIVLLMSNEKIMEKFNIPIVKISHVMKRFQNNYALWKTKNIILTDEIISKEINNHPSDSVITEEEKSILSLFYGIKNEFNNSGNKYTKVLIGQIVGIDQRVVAKKIKEACFKIKSRMIGILNPENIFMPRDEVTNLLNDSHLPLSNDKKEIVCYLLGLNGYPYKTIDELSKMMRVQKHSLKRAYDRAILIMYKYKNYEIEGKIDYEEDVLPNLKYFSKSDELFIRESFGNGLTNASIAEKYNLSLDTVNRNIKRLKVDIYELVMNKTTRKFDFEYYREAIENSQLPFYGDLKLAKNIFDLFVGESCLGGMSLPKIKETLDIPFGESAINKMIRYLMVSVYNLRNGVVKDELITSEKVLQYYNENKECMTLRKKKIYERCLNTYFENRLIFSRSFNNISIIFDLLKHHYPNYFNLETISRDEVLALLKKYHKELNKKTVLSLMSRFDISEREFMSGKDINHVFKILNRLEQLKRGLNEGQKLQRTS